ncbi:MAG: hypothetical protein LWX07_06610 [Bacteroidetes bacterium]|nr:hypothetical protein [Bacteroidota bacterium]
MEEKEKWICRALIFSGLKDPEWKITASEAEEILSALDTENKTDDFALEEDVSGYRGCVLKSPGGVYWRAFNGVVKVNDNGKIFFCIDVGRKFEKLLIGSAPAGIIAGNLLNI